MINFLRVASIVIIINVTALPSILFFPYLVLKSSLNLSLITVRFLRNILLFHEFPGSILKVAEINLYLLGIYDDKLQM